jgi:hypothetical protein
VQQRGEHRPVSAGEPYLLTVQLPLEDRDLVPEGQDLRILGPIAQRQQSQHRKRVRHAEVSKSKQHSQASSPSRRWRKRAEDVGRGRISSW